MEALRATPHDLAMDTKRSMERNDMVAAWKQLGRSKGAGRDRLPSELFLALAPVIAAPATDLYNETIDRERWPTRWTGGHMQDVFKNKGARDGCDDYRCIVLQDHLA